MENFQRILKEAAGSLKMADGFRTIPVWSLFFAILAAFMAHAAQYLHSVVYILVPVQQRVFTIAYDLFAIPRTPPSFWSPLVFDRADVVQHFELPGESFLFRLCVFSVALYVHSWLPSVGGAIKASLNLMDERILRAHPQYIENSMSRAHVLTTTFYWIAACVYHMEKGPHSDIVFLFLSARAVTQGSVLARACADNGRWSLLPSLVVWTLLPAIALPLMGLYGLSGFSIWLGAVVALLVPDCVDFPNVAYGEDPARGCPWDVVRLEKHYMWYFWMFALYNGCWVSCALSYATVTLELSVIAWQIRTGQIRVDQIAASDEVPDEKKFTWWYAIGVTLHDTIQPLKKVAFPLLSTAGGTYLVTTLLGLPFWIVVFPLSGVSCMKLGLGDVVEAAHRFRHGTKFWQAIRRNQMDDAKRLFLERMVSYPEVDTMFKIDAVENYIVNEVLSLLALLYLLFTASKKGKVAAFFLYMTSARVKAVLAGIEMVVIGLASAIPGTFSDVSGAATRMSERMKEQLRARRNKLQDDIADVREKLKLKVADEKVRDAAAKLVAKIDALVERIKLWKGSTDVRLTEDYLGDLAELRAKVLSAPEKFAHAVGDTLNYLRQVEKRFRSKMSNSGVINRWRKLTRRDSDTGVGLGVGAPNAGTADLDDLELDKEQLELLALSEVDAPMIADPEADYDEATAISDYLPEMAIVSTLQNLASSVARGFGMKQGDPTASEIRDAKELVQASKVLDASKKSGEFFVRVVKFGLDFAYRRIFGHDWAAPVEVTERIKAWNEYVVDNVLPAFREGRDLTSVDIVNLQEAYDVGLSILSTMEAKKERLLSYPFFAHNFELLKVWRTKVSLRAASRPVPASILLAGPGCTGKSGAAVQIAKAIAYQLGMDPKKEDDIMYVVSDNTADGKKFRDGYKAQPVFIQDDLGNINDPELQISTITDVMSMLGHTTYSMNAGEAERKDHILFTSKYWIGTTNADPNSLLFTDKYAADAYIAFRSRIAVFAVPLTNRNYKPFLNSRGEFPHLKVRKLYDVIYEGEPAVPEFVTQSSIRLIEETDNAVRADVDAADTAWAVHVYKKNKRESVFLSVATTKDLTNLLLARSIHYQKCYEKYKDKSVDVRDLIEVPDSMKKKTLVPPIDFKIPMAKDRAVAKYFMVAFAVLATAGSGWALWNWLHGSGEQESSSNTDYPVKDAPTPKVAVVAQGPVQEVHLASTGSQTEAINKIVAKNMRRLTMEIMAPGAPRMFTGVLVGVHANWYVTASHVVEPLLQAANAKIPMKIFINGVEVNPKSVLIRIDAYRHLAAMRVDHPGLGSVKDIRDKFVLDRPKTCMASIVTKDWSQVGPTPGSDKLWSDPNSYSLEYNTMHELGMRDITENGLHGKAIKRYTCGLLDLRSRAHLGESGSAVVLRPVKDGEARIVAGVLISCSKSAYMPAATVTTVTRKWIDENMVEAQQACSGSVPKCSELYQPHTEPFFPNARVVGLSSVNKPVIGGSHFREGPFLGYLPCARKPPIMHQVEGYSPSENALKKMLQPAFVVSAETNSHLDWFSKEVAKSIQVPLRKHALNIFEAVNGARDLLYSRPMPFDTGAGVRFDVVPKDGDPNRFPVGGVIRKIKGKLPWLIGQGSFFDPSPNLIAAVESVPNDVRTLSFSLKHNETRAFKSGNVILPGPDFAAQLAAEEPKDARPLLGDDLAFAIFDRMHLTVFLDAYYRSHLDTSSLGGLNPLDAESWKRVWFHLELDSRTRYDFGDVKAFGFSTPKELWQAAWKTIVYWHEINGFTPQYIANVRICEEKFFSAVIQHKRLVFEKVNPGIDGVLLTFLLNSIANELRSRVCYAVHLEANGFTREEARLFTQKDYRCKKGGDDSADTWTRSDYSPKDIERLSKELFGYEVTSATKGPVPEQYTEAEFQILKRMITRDGRAPLDKTSIYNIGNYVHKNYQFSKDEVMATAELTLAEAMHWGPEFYQEVADAIAPACEKFGVRLHDCATYPYIEAVNMWTRGAVSEHGLSNLDIDMQWACVLETDPQVQERRRSLWHTFAPVIGGRSAYFLAYVGSPSTSVFDDSVIDEIENNRVNIPSDYAEQWFGHGNYAENNDILARWLKVRQAVIGGMHVVPAFVAWFGDVDWTLRYPWVALVTPELRDETSEVVLTPDDRVVWLNQPTHGDFTDDSSDDEQVATVLEQTEEKVETKTVITEFGDDRVPTFQPIAPPVNPMLARAAFPTEPGLAVLREHRTNISWAYTAAAGAGIVTRSYPKDYTYSSYRDRITWYRHMRFGIKVQVRFNPGSATYGAALIAWTPGQTPVPTEPQNLCQTLFEPYVTMSGYEHFVADINSPEPIEFVIPFVGPSAFLHTKDYNSVDIGTWRMVVLQPLKSANEANAPPCNILISESVVGFELVAPQDASGKDEPMEMVRKGVEAVGRGILHAAAQGAVSSIVRVPALAAPVNTAEPTRVVNVPALNYASTEGAPLSHVLGPSYAARTSDDFAIMATDNKMKATTFMGTPMIIRHFSMPGNASPGDIIDKWGVNPAEQHTYDDGVTEYVTSTFAAAYITTFRRWRGTTKYALYVFSSPLLRLRFSIRWTPDDSLLATGRGDAYQRVIELTGSGVVTFSVPFQSLTHSNDSSYDQNGWIKVVLEQPVAPFVSGVLPDILFVLYVAADDDMQVFVPQTQRNFFATQLASLSSVEANPRELFRRKFPPLIEGVTHNLSNTLTSYDFDDLRALMRMPNVRSFNLNTPWFALKSNTSYFDYFRRCFLFNRGSVRYVVIVGSGRVESWTTVSYPASSVSGILAVHDYNLSAIADLVLPWNHREPFIFSDSAFGPVGCNNSLEILNAVDRATVNGDVVAADDFTCGWLVPPPIITFPVGTTSAAIKKFKELEKAAKLHASPKEKIGEAKAPEDSIPKPRWT